MRLNSNLIKLKIFMSKYQVGQALAASYVDERKVSAL